MPESLPPDDVRSEARRALDFRPIDSMRKAFQVFLGVGTLCGILGGGLAVEHQFSSLWLYALTSLTVLSGVIAYIIEERSALLRQSDLLRKLLDSEKYFENLLRTAQQEQQAAEEHATRLEMQLGVLDGVRSVIERGQRSKIAGTKRGSQDG